MLWLKRLRFKFQNNRRRKESMLEVVTEKKMKFNIRKSLQLMTDNGVMLGITNYKTR